MPVEDACSVCSIDVLEIVAAGGNSCDSTEPLSCKQRFIGISYMVLHICVSVLRAVIERNALDSSVSAKSEIAPFNSNSTPFPIVAIIGHTIVNIPEEMEYMWGDLADVIDSDTAVGLWSAGFWVLTVVVIPIHLWLFMYQFFKVQECCCDRNPFCCCFKKHNSNSRGYKFCMEVNIILFLMFEDIVHIVITVARLYFVTGEVANALAYKESNQVDTAMYIEIAADGVNFLYRWMSLYCGCLCNNVCICNQGEHKGILCFFKLLQFLVSASALYFALLCLAILSFSFIKFTVFYFAVSYGFGMAFCIVFTFVISSFFWCFWCCCCKKDDDD